MSIADTGRFWEILGNTGYTSIADTGRFWKILVIPVLQILEDSGTILVIPVLQILENTGYIIVCKSVCKYLSYFVYLYGVLIEILTASVV